LGKSVSGWVDVTSGVPQGSVLGPILFVIYINDLPDVLESLCEMFADDTKIMSKVNNKKNCSNLQVDLAKIEEWTKDWLVKLNDDKCKVMHLGPNNPTFDYSMNGTSLSKTDTERDLGIMISNDLKWAKQVNSAASKANTVLGSIKRTIRFQSKESINRLFKAFVRPHLEYGVQVWNPYLKKDINVLESVQRRASKIVPELKKLSYNQRLEALNWTSLETRRLRGDLIQMFKIVNGIDKVIWHKPLVFKGIQDSTSQRILRGHELKLERQLVKNCDQRYNFFTNRVVNVWNKLDKDVVNSKTINNFKNKIDKLNLYKLSQ
jgi:hypothetical protein